MPEPAPMPRSAGGEPAATTGILFDQRSRYHSLAAAVEALVPRGGTVLDVGSGQAMLLRNFLPHHRVVCLDPLLAGSNAPDTIGAPFTDGVAEPRAFDAVVCVDVLEHVPPDARPAFLARMAAAARRGIVVSAPFADAGEALQVDNLVHATYQVKTGKDYPWLEEHERYGLPELRGTLALLRELGMTTTVSGNGHVPWLEELLGLHVALLDEPLHLPFLQRIGDRFGDELLALDHLEPVYRQVVIASRGAAVAMTQDAGPAVQQAAQVAWRRFRAWFAAEVGSYADNLLFADGALSRQLLAKERQLRAAAEHETALARAESQRLAREASHWHAAAGAAAAQMAALRASWSWRLGAPLRVAHDVALRAARLTGRALLGLAYAAKSVVPRSWAYPLKAAFFGVFRPLLKGTREYAEFQTVKRWPPAPEIDATDIAPGDGVHDDIVVFGVIDWHFRKQRPQHLATELARRGHRVFYLAPAFVPDKRSGYTIQRIDTDAPVHEVRLHVPDPPSLYDGSPEGRAFTDAAASLRMLLRDVRLGPVTAFVDHPGWTGLAATLPRCNLVYDCMDNHHGFATAKSRLVDDERRLVALADMVVVTSDQLETEMRALHHQVVTVRNACDPVHFASARKTTKTPRPVIAYFGAIAEWFDVDMLREVATTMADVDFLMIGADTAQAALRVGPLPNVSWTGEVSYEELPKHLARADAVFVPFLINPLTLATNPVKAYEALAAGKPVVATPMPELMRPVVEQFVRVAEDAPTCVAALRAALADAAEPALIAQRVAFAEQRSWRARAEQLDQALDAQTKPRFGVVIVSWNGVDLTRRCLRSVLDDPAAPELDVVIVDNASSDGTGAWLDQLATEPRVRVIRNAENRGFAAACNQGLRAAAANGADVLVILNNDIVVTPGWARTIATHLRRDPGIGLIGPITNNIGNEARVATRYADMAGMLDEQAALTGANAGLLFDIPVLAFFCVAMPADVYARVGDLDVAFGTGFFEDDDYCQRVRRLGRRIVCAEDVFVHHELSASFAKVDPEAKQRLFERNRAYYESKWGPWQAHTYRRERNEVRQAAE